MSRKRDVDSLFDSVTKELYEERRDKLNSIHHDKYKHDFDDDCKDEWDDECHNDTDNDCHDDSDEDCVENAICDILKSQKKIMCCMEDMFCNLTKEIDRLPSTSDKVILYKKLLCAFAKKDCSLAQLLKALAKLEKVNNERESDHEEDCRNREDCERRDCDDHRCRGCNGPLFRRC